MQELTVEILLLSHQDFGSELAPQLLAQLF